MRIIVVYASQTGNTEMMANAVCQGIKEAGENVFLEHVSLVKPAEVLEEEVIAFGSPAMGAEVLDDAMEELFSAVENSLPGKKVALFGSYDWGDGQWMRDWEERVKAAGGNFVGSVIAHLEPTEQDLAACMELGAKLV